MSTCKTCKWWGSGAPDSLRRECSHPKLCEPPEALEQPDATDLLVSFYSNAGGFFTGPDFGCIHHEANA